MPPPKPGGEVSLPSIQYRGAHDRKKCTYKVNDDVMMRGEGSEEPFVAKILEIKAPKDAGKRAPENTFMKVVWYYRPEEVNGGRKTFHGARELFASDHEDAAIPLASVLTHARVLPFQAFLDATRPSVSASAGGPAAAPSTSKSAGAAAGDDDDGDGGDDPTPPLFYSRYTFLPERGKRRASFRPERVDVVCSCRLPYNPDPVYVACAACGASFHPECVGLGAGEAAAGDAAARGWRCDACGEEGGSKRAKAA